MPNKKRLSQESVRRIWGAGRASAEAEKKKSSMWACIWNDLKQPMFAGEVTSRENGYVEFDVLNCVTGELSGQLKKAPENEVVLYKDSDGLNRALSAFWKEYYRPMHEENDRRNRERKTESTAT